jgi:hypothetical protein
VLVRSAVSVTCCTDFSGTRKWFLTRESGQVPVCKHPGRCGCDRTELSAAELRKAYMVMCCPDGDHWYSNIVAELSKESISCVADRLCPAVSEAGWRTSKDQAFLSLLREGTRSRTGCIGCVASRGVCGVCASAVETGVGFVVADGFAGVVPFPAAPWFLGVSDARSMECVGSKGEWNSCVWEARQQRAWSRPQFEDTLGI